MCGRTPPHCVHPRMDAGGGLIHPRSLCPPVSRPTLTYSHGVCPTSGLAPRLAAGL